MFDAFIVLISLIEYFLLTTTAASAVRLVRLIRLTRLAKVVRMAGKMKSLQIVLRVLEAMGPCMSYIVMLSLLIMFIFAVLGMGLFGGKMSQPDVGVPDSNFDSFPRAILSTFQLVSLEDWPVLFANLKVSRGWGSVLYVIAVIVIGNFVLLNLMLAIMLSFFETKSAEVLNQMTKLDEFLSSNDQSALKSSTVHPEPWPEADQDETECEEVEGDLGPKWFDKLEISEEPDSIAGWCRIYRDPEVSQAV